MLILYQQCLDFVLKMMKWCQAVSFALQMVNFGFKTMNFVLKMMKFRISEAASTLW